MKVRRLTGAIAAATAVTIGAGGFLSAAGAVPAHQHVVNNPGGSHDIANGFCNGNFADGTAPQHGALHNFHILIHTGPQGPENGIVTITSTGC